MQKYIVFILFSKKHLLKNEYLPVSMSYESIQQYNIN